MNNNDHERKYPATNIEANAKYPLFGSKVQCGFPSPADDYIEDRLGLNDLLVKHPSATFFVKASGNSINKVGLFDGDLLVVDRSLHPVDGHIVVAAIEGELTVKRLKMTGSQAYLMPENPDYSPIQIKRGSDVYFWGVVTYVVHSLLS